MKNVPVQAISAGVLGFGLVVAVGAFVVLPHAPATGAPPALSGRLFAPAPVAAPFPGGAASAAAPAPAMTSSPAPLLSDEFRDGSAASAPAAAAPAATAPAASAPAAASAASGGAAAKAPGLAALAAPGASGASTSSSASASAAAAAVAAGGAPVRRTSAGRASKSSVAATATAASVHYGTNSRAELMAPGAGPVYNFGALGANSDPIAAAMQQVDNAQKQVNATNGVSDADKAAMQQDVDQAHAVGYAADQAVQQATVQAGAPSAPASR